MLTIGTESMVVKSNVTDLPVLPKFLLMAGLLELTMTETLVTGTWQPGKDMEVLSPL